MKQLVTRSLVGVAGLGLVIGASALPASADTSATFSATGAAASTSAPSGYLAGYTAKPKGGVKKATVKTITVPEVSCTPDLYGMQLGVSEQSVEGAPTAGSSVWVACDGGAPLYALYASGPAGEDLQIGGVAPGDKVKMEIVYAGGNVTATTTNVTQGTTATATGAIAAPATIHFGSFPLYAGGVLAGVPDFDSAKIVKAAANGKAVTAKDTKYDRKSGSTLQIKTSKAKKGSFSLAYKAH